MVTTGTMAWRKTWRSWIMNGGKPLACSSMTKSCRDVSIMAIRVTRATSAIPPKPAAMTGRMSELQPRAPETGTQPSHTAKTRISSRPSQKLGTVEPSRMKPVMASSMRVPW